MGEDVAYWSWEYGRPVQILATYCPWCALHIKVSGYFIADAEA